MTQRIILITLLLITVLSVNAQTTETKPEHLVQISGVVVESDSLIPLPFVSIMIRNTSRGTISDFYGFFTLVAKPGDELQFFSLSHKNATYKIPDSLSGKHYSIIQVLTMDTILLAGVPVYPWPTKEEFKKAFLNLDLTDTDYERAAKNLEREDLRESINGSTMDASANYRIAMQQHYTKIYTAGQFPSISLLNPSAWAQFIDAWRKGKFKKQPTKK